MKKLTALILALVMLALPALGLAASPVELLSDAVEAGRPLSGKVYFEGGEMPLDANTAAIVNDVLNALSFRFDEQEGDAPQSDFALVLSGKDVLTFALAEKAEEYYLKSNLLGEDTVAFTAEEGVTILERFMQVLVDSGAMTQSDADELKQQLNAMMSGSAASMEEFDPANLDASELVAYITKIAERAKTEEVTAQPKNCDQAKTKITFSLTGEEIAKVYELVFQMLQKNDAFMAQLDQMLKSANSKPATGKELMDEAIVKMNEAFTGIVGDVPFAFYENEAGELVYATMDMAMREDKDDDDVITVAVEYARLTVNEGVTHNVNLIAKEDGDAADGASITVSVLAGEKRTTVDFAAAEIDDGVTQKPVMSVAFALDMDHAETTAKDQMVVDMVVVDDNSKEEMGFTIKADLNGAKDGEDATLQADVKFFLMGAEKELFTVKVEAATGTAAPSIVSDAAVRPAPMEDAEFNAFVGQALQSMQVVLATALQSLPTSVLQLMMN